MIFIKILIYEIILCQTHSTPEIVASTKGFRGAGFYYIMDS
jgi:hypothetical protein